MISKKSVVIALGGSIISGDDINLKFMKEFSKMISGYSNEYKFGIVVGGGKPVKKYIHSLREYHVNDSTLDEIGIYATRMNALAMTTFFDNSNIKIPVTVDNAVEILSNHNLVIMGGTEPGHTTDTVSTLLAEKTGSKILINATSVDGVYSDDPEKNPDAKKFSALNYDKAIELSVGKSIGAGPRVFMDITSLNIAKRAAIKVFVINGLNLEGYKEILEHDKTHGTIIN